MLETNNAGRTMRDAPPVVTTFDSLTGIINERLRSIVDRQNVVAEGLNRLINPRPVNAVSDQKEPIAREARTHEDKLNGIIKRLDTILSDEIDQSDTLNSAV